MNNKESFGREDREREERIRRLREELERLKAIEREQEERLRQLPQIVRKMEADLKKKQDEVDRVRYGKGRAASENQTFGCRYEMNNKESFGREDREREERKCRLRKEQERLIEIEREQEERLRQMEQVRWQMEADLKKKNDAVDRNRDRYGKGRAASAEIGLKNTSENQTFGCQIM